VKIPAASDGYSNISISIDKGDNMLVQELTKSNIMLYAMAHYNTDACLSLQEFKSDMRLFKSLNTQISRDDDLNLKAALNIMVTLHNQFGFAASRIIMFYLDDDNHRKARSILNFLNILPPDFPHTEQDNKYLDRIENITR